MTDALNHTTAFEYDEVGNLIATVDPLGNRTLRFYDAVSRLIAIVDGRGKGTQFTYDNLNRITQIEDAINGITAFTYDPNGNLLTVVDAKNQTTTYTYDNMDRLATRKDALNRTESYQYDLAGNLTQFTDRKNQVTTFQYDALNRRTQVTYPDATTTFTYDTVGRLAKASDTAPGAGTIDFAYDILDRLIQETTPQGTVAYQYDVLGRRTQMVANGQQPTTYQYDAASRLTRVEQGALFAQLGYDNANRRTSLGYSNNTSTSYAYDLASRLTGITHNGPSGVIDALTYQYDAAGNRVSLTRGNGTASLLPNAVASATYDAANEQTAFAGATLTYNQNGNLTNDGVNTYQWDARNRLIGVSGGATAAFNYDALGRRTTKVVGSITSQFLYDRHDVAAEIGGAAVGATYLRSLMIDEPFIRQTSLGNEHYHVDALGSSLALSTTQGNAGTTYTYEPFGKTTTTGTSGNPFQFTGREQEGPALSGVDGTGLYYYRARYYQPRVQRFLSEDPIGFLGGDVNLYGYVGQNPVLMTDPSGHTPVIGCALGALVGAAAGYVYVVDTTLGKKKPNQAYGVLTGAALGCVAGLFPLQGLPGVILGGGLGAYTGAATALAQSHGDPNNLANNMIQSMITNGIGGAIGGGVFGLPGAVLGTVVSTLPSNAYNLVNRSINTSPTMGPGAPNVPGLPK
mgnify:CR=1 FL=1